MLVAFAGVPFLDVTLNFLARGATPHSPCAHLAHRRVRGKKALCGCAGRLVDVAKKSGRGANQQELGKPSPATSAMAVSHRRISLDGSRSVNC